MRCSSVLTQGLWSKLRETQAQASVEAALLLPILMGLCALLLQPVCVLYTKAVMYEAASEGLQLALSASSQGLDTRNAQDYVRRRLKAVPTLDLFCVGGPEQWEIELSADSDASCVVAGDVRPLPILGIATATLGERRGALVHLRVEVSEQLHPSWLEGGYHDWISIWAS